MPSAAPQARGLGTILGQGVSAATTSILKGQERTRSAGPGRVRSTPSPQRGRWRAVGTISSTGTSWTVLSGVELVTVVTVGDTLAPAAQGYYTVDAWAQVSSAPDVDFFKLGLGGPENYDYDYPPGVAEFQQEGSTHWGGLLGRSGGAIATVVPILGGGGDWTVNIRVAGKLIA